MSGTVSEVFVAVYDNQSRNWSTDPQINELFLRSVNNYLNDRLKIKGHLFLNEVYDELDIPRTSRGQLVGWLSSNGSFGDLWTSEHDEENSFTLTFTVDGVIYEDIA